MKKYSKIFIINIIILIVIFFLVEIIISVFKPNYLILDKELGWKMKPNYKKDKTEKDLYGQTYNVKFEVDNRGVVNVGDEKNKSLSILVLGDSFSLDPYVSKEKMWYGILQTELNKIFKENIAINVIGAGGYGILQEYLLMKKLNLNNDLPEPSRQVGLLALHLLNPLKETYRADGDRKKIIRKGRKRIKY